MKSLATMNQICADMQASFATMQFLAGTAKIYQAAGPRDRQPCVLYHHVGTGLKAYAWLESAAWGIEPIVYHIQGGIITGPTSQLAQPNV